MWIGLGTFKLRTSVVSDIPLSEWSAWTMFCCLSRQCVVLRNHLHIDENQTQ